MDPAHKTTEEGDAQFYPVAGVAQSESRRRRLRK